jgi:membrane protein YqaA with SNARE-associated domain
MMAFSTKKRRGRPKVERLPHDYGNDRTQARTAMFRRFMGDSSIGHEMSCAGRLMLVGCFDGMEQPAETILSALLEYANGYWSQYVATAPKVAAYERSDRSHDNVWADRRGAWFDEMDDRLRSAGHAARKAVHDITVSRHWFPDEDCGWSGRIINLRLLEKGLPVCGEVATVNDSAWNNLELARAGAIALLGKALRRAA